MKVRPIYPVWLWAVWTLLVPLTLLAVGFTVLALTDRDELLLDNQHLWWLGVAGPLAGAVSLYGCFRRRRALEAFTSAQLAPLLTARISPARQAFRAGLLSAAVLLIVGGAIGPRWGMHLEKQRVYGVDIVVALDVSRSMLARDLAPNRLDRAKRVLREQLIDRAAFGQTNRLALLAFAGSTSLKLPLTTDHLAFRSKLDAIQIGSAPRGGTAIGEAIRAATDLFARSPAEATKLILLLTDGEDHEGGPVEAARTAYNEHGIRTYTVGVGDATRPAGAQVPAAPGPNARPLLYDGQIVFSKLNTAALQEIAVAGQGRFTPLSAFHRQVSAMSGLRKTELSMEERIRHIPRYQWFVTAAMCLLLLETLIGDRRPTPAAVPQRIWQQEFA